MAKDLEARIREVAKKHGRHGGADTRSPGPETEGKDSAEIVQLPLWYPQQEYGAPVSILRSALFGVVRRGRRPYYEDTEITAWKGVAIRYTGPRLDQADEDVWLQVLQLHQEQQDAGLGTRFEVSIKGLLRELGRASGQKNREWLRKSLTRLVATAVSVQADRHEYTGSLVDEFVRDEATGRYTISVNPRMAALFRHGWSKLERDQRLALGQDQTAKWLHSFISTHRADPLRIGFDKIHALGGSEAEMREYRRSVRRALDHLVVQGTIRAWSDDGHVVTVWR